MHANSDKTVEVKSTLRRLRLFPRKALGQHFLVGDKALTDILEASKIFGKTVVEIGPGLGVLTKKLAEHARKVVAIEVDTQLAAALQREFAEFENLQVLCADARYVEVEGLVGKEHYKLVANLPYYAAMPILRRFLESSHPPTHAVVMCQREVAMAMVAGPGKMSLLSVAIQLYGHPRIVGVVLPSAFYPPPKVTSTIVHIEVYQKPVLEVQDKGKFFALVRGGFAAPRKQLRNSLSYGLNLSLDTAAEMLWKADIDSKRRPQTLSLDEWGGLFGVFLESELKHG